MIVGVRKFYAATIADAVASYLAIGELVAWDLVIGRAGRTDLVDNVVLFALWPVIQPLVAVHYVAELFTRRFESKIFLHLFIYVIALTIIYRVLRRSPRIDPEYSG